MAKKAKGPAESPSRPKPVQNNPDTEPFAEKPCCMFCCRSAAKNIDATHLPGEPGIFCSWACAAAWAVGFIASSRTEWCKEHGRWTDTKGKCYCCEAFKSGYTKPLFSRTAETSSEGKEANNG